MGIRELKKLSIFRNEATKKSTVSRSKYLEYQNLVGKKFNKWTILDILNVQSGMRRCLAKCECGNTYSRDLKTIKDGQTTQCRSCSSYKYTACQRKPGHKPKSVRKAIYDKNRQRTSESCCWSKMKGRCYTKTDKAYKNYGGRGISVCERWIHSCKNFLKDMGQKPSSNHSLDRIDVNGNYEPKNCRWATSKEQALNRRTVSKLEEKIKLLEGELKKYKRICSRNGFKTIR